MKELFRFGVLRPANRSQAKLVSLSVPETDSSAPNALATSAFQAQLLNVLQGFDTSPVPADVWTVFEPIAIEFVVARGPGIITNALWTELPAFVDDVTQEIAAWTALPIDTTGLTAVYSSAPSGSALVEYKRDLADLFLALVIVRRGGPRHLDGLIRDRLLWANASILGQDPAIADVADRLRIVDLIQAGVTPLLPPSTVANAADAIAFASAAVNEVMTRTILFPPALLSPLAKPIHGVGFRELHVVRQHIRKYELGEISRIENILAGETRSHIQKHTLSRETDTTVTTSTTTETDKEITNTDHVAISNEANSQLKEDTKLDAGVHAQYDGGGSFKLQTDLTVAYDKSTDETRKYASNVAKDVTQKAVNKVTTQIVQSQTTKVAESFEDTESQGFQNQTTTNVSGVYQWLEKVYLAQVFNLGRHMILDIMVPEPGAALLAAAALPPSGRTAPVQPDPLGTFHVDPVTKLKVLDEPLQPDQLEIDPSNTTNYFGVWVAKYQVTGVPPLPPARVVVAKSVTGKRDDDVGQVLSSDSVKIDDGYEASSVNVLASWVHFVPTHYGNEANVDVAVGKQRFHFDKDGATSTGGATNTVSPYSANDYASSLDYTYPAAPDKSRERGQIAVSVAAVWVEHVAVTVEVVCDRTDEQLAAWKVTAYEKIAAAWQKVESDYESAMALLAQTSGATTLGAANPDANRVTERQELKRSCVAIIDNANETVRGVGAQVAMADSPDPTPNAVPDPWKPVLPEPILANAQQVGSNVRWFEQAFEWENMAYVLYPYYWGRRTTWLDRLNLKVDDALFLQFLQAGSARVVVPVRLGFEQAVQFYLNTGLPWLGGPLPTVADGTQNPLYLDIADEIRALTDGGERGETVTPIGDPWEYTLPTELVRLNPDGSLPEWHRVDPNLPSDPPATPWDWADGPPPNAAPTT